MNKVNIEKFRAYIDLHLHLDGSLDIPTVRELMKINNINDNYTDEELREKLMVKDDNKDLNEYLSKFAFPQTLLQTKEAIEYAIYSLNERLKREGYIYAEIRFAPQFHLQKGLTQEEVINAVIRGNNKSNFKSNIILCLMRGSSNREENIETVRLAYKYLNKGIKALDLAGAEALYPTSSFRDEFSLARQYHIPFTIHAGEAAGADSVKLSIEYGAKRIGHGGRSFKDLEVLNLAKENNVTYEVCPKSNLDTKAISSVLDYDLRNLLSNGINITINTDNLSVSSTNIVKEYELLNDEYDLTNEEFKKLLINSANAAFLNVDEKKILINKINEEIDRIRDWN